MHTQIENLWNEFVANIENNGVETINQNINDENYTKVFSVNDWFHCDNIECENAWAEYYDSILSKSEYISISAEDMMNNSIDVNEEYSKKAIGLFKNDDLSGFNDVINLFDGYSYQELNDFIKYIIKNIKDRELVIKIQQHIISFL